MDLVETAEHTDSLHALLIVWLLSSAVPESTRELQTIALGPVYLVYRR